MNTLLTGSNGYLASHLIQSWSLREESLILLDKTPARKLKGNYKFIKSDLSNISELLEVIQKHEISTVINLAALKSVKQSIDFPEFVKNTNLSTTMNLLEASKAGNVRSFIFASSAAVYSPKISYSMIDESSLISPVNAYGESKALCEKLVLEYSDVLNSCILRFFNLVGSSSPELMDRNGENFIPILLRSIASGSTITVYGNSFETKDGFAVRDFVDVRDSARAITAAFAYMSSQTKNSSEIFNVCSGEEISVFRIIDELQRLSGNKLNYKISDAREGESPFSVGNAKKASKFLSWHTERSFSESLKDDYLNFFRV
jgi:UDP-glucose 4-epimerase